MSVAVNCRVADQPIRVSIKVAFHLQQGAHEPAPCTIRIRALTISEFVRVINRIVIFAVLFRHKYQWVPVCWGLHCYKRK